MSHIKGVTCIVSIRGILMSHEAKDLWHSNKIIRADEKNAGII